MYIIRKDVKVIHKLPCLTTMDDEEGEYLRNNPQWTGYHADSEIIHNGQFTMVIVLPLAFFSDLIALQHSFVLVICTEIRKLPTRIIVLCGNSKRQKRLHGW